MVLKVSVPALVAFPVAPKIWNLALVVVFPPIAISSDALSDEIILLFLWRNPLVVADEERNRLLIYALSQ